MLVGFKLQEPVPDLALDEEGKGFQDCRMADSDNKVSLARLPLGQGHEAMFQIRRSDPGALKGVVDQLQSLSNDHVSLPIACRACTTVCHTLPSLRQALFLDVLFWVRFGLVPTLAFLAK